MQRDKAMPFHMMEPQKRKLGEKVASLPVKMAIRCWHEAALPIRLDSKRRRLFVQFHKAVQDFLCERRLRNKIGRHRERLIYRRDVLVILPVRKAEEKRGRHGR